MMTPGGVAVAFADEVEKKAEPVRRAILAHPFVTGIGDGTLDVEKFKFYVRQDYVYLMDYSRVLAMASARAPDLDAMGRFARLLHETLNTEMELHRGFCAQLGITAGELEATEAAPTTLAYTGFLLNVAHQRSYAELAASLPMGLLGDMRPPGQAGRAGGCALVQSVDKDVHVQGVQGPG